MLKKVLIIFAYILYFISSSYEVHSQSQTIFNFLKLDVDARSASMAGNFMAVENDVNTIFYNPAGLSTLKGTKASAGFFKYLLDINSGNVSYSQKYKNYGYFGAGIRYINYGSFDRYTDEYQDQPLGTFSASDLALSLSYSNIYKDRINYGATIKFIYSSYDEYKSTALALDLGLMYKIPSQSLNIGVSLLNLGTQLKPYIDTRENLPLDLRIGASKKLEHLPLTFHLGFTRLSDSYDKFINRFKNVILGGEFNVSEYVDLRVGYNNQLRQDLKTGSAIGLAGFSAGLGLKYEDKYTLDYAFTSLGKIGTTHRINIGFNLK